MAETAAAALVLLGGRVMDELLALAADGECAEERLVVFDEL